mgnify:CR=1 FL=1
MEKRNLVLVAAAACVLAVCSYGIFTHCTQKVKTDNDNLQTNESSEVVEQKDYSETAGDSVSEKKSDVKESSNIGVQQVSIEKADLYKGNTVLYRSAAADSMPLSVLAAISDMPKTIQDKVSKIAEANNIYMMQKNNDKLIIITDNPSNIRHCVEFNEISLKNGHQIKTTLGYNDKFKDSENDIWEYERDTHRPIRHTKYNKDGDVDFVEVWNYSNDEPIKYEMKDSEGKVISLRKETLENGVDLRVEHLVYDKDGNTKINVSATYDGPDVKRFTYYNADKPSESGSVYGEYSDGQKTKETVYTSDLKLKNSYTAKYKDGECEELTIWDNQNKEINTLSTKNAAEAL